MNKYKILNLFRRLGLFLLVIWTVVSLVTILIELVPGDSSKVTKYSRNMTRVNIEGFRLVSKLEPEIIRKGDSDED